MKYRLLLSALMICLVLPGSAQIDKIRMLKNALPQIGDSLRYVDVMNKISLLFYEQNADSTLYYARSAREIARRLNYPKGIADATNNLGIVFDIKSNTQLALRYYNDAYKQYKALGDSSNVVQMLMNIGMVYELSGKKDKALSNLNQALELGNRISHDSITALLIYNYILLFPDRFKGEVRDQNLKKATAIGIKYKDLRMQLAIEQLRADDLISKNEHQKGITLLKQTLERSLEMQLYYFSMDLLIELGDLYIAAEPDSGLAYYTRALKISELKGYRSYSSDVCKRLLNYYNKKKDITRAYSYSEKLLRIYEQQAEIDRASGIDYIEYAVKDEELKSAQLSSQYNAKMLILALIVCVLTILSIIFLYRNWKLSRKTNEVLTLQFHQLETTSEALEKSNQNYARVIKMVAHDLRNPIGGIHALSNLLKEEKLSEEDTSQFVGLIEESSRSCLNLIGDLLQTDFEIKESELHKEPIDLGTLLKQTITLLAFRANEKNQQLILGDVAKITVTADRDKLLRVLNNLIVNAIKFTPNAGKIDVNTNADDEGVTISVKDTGLGIPKSAAERLFDPFTSAKRKGTAGEQPFGLGLYISKQIIEAHHGRIWFESEEGKGTTFSVWLPGN